MSPSFVNISNDCDDCITSNLTQNRNIDTISFLNVCGIFPKLQVPDFTDFIKSNSINCVVETKLNEIDVDNLVLPSGYKGKFKCRNYCSLSKSGGIGIIYRDCLNNLIQEIKTVCNFVAWFKIDKVAFGLRKHLILGVVYIPPVGSKYTNVDAFEQCQLDLVELLAHNYAFVCICGDFNARTGNEVDVIDDNIFAV